MRFYMYISVSREDRISVLTVDSDTGLLEPSPIMGSDSSVPGINRLGICSRANKPAGLAPVSPSADIALRTFRREVDLSIINQD